MSSKAKHRLAITCLLLCSLPFSTHVHSDLGVCPHNTTEFHQCKCLMILHWEIRKSRTYLWPHINNKAQGSVDINFQGNSSVYGYLYHKCRWYAITSRNQKLRLQKLTNDILEMFLERHVSLILTGYNINLEHKIKLKLKMRLLLNGGKENKHVAIQWDNGVATNYKPSSEQLFQTQWRSTEPLCVWETLNHHIQESVYLMCSAHVPLLAWCIPQTSSGESIKYIDDSDKE